MFGIEIIESNLGIALENIILMVVVLGSTIFAAKDFKIGLIMLMVMSGGLFVWFYESGLVWVNSLIVMLLSFIVMALSLYAAQKSSVSGGLV
jgi:hypothetical protein